MPKHRVVVPLAEPFVITEVAKTQDEGMKLWNQVPKALARFLGDLPLDKAALDPSRLFYFPRHAKGRAARDRRLRRPAAGLEDARSRRHPEGRLRGRAGAGGRQEGQPKSGTAEGQALARWSRKPRTASRSST
jgi:hypothetical protein